MRHSLLAILPALVLTTTAHAHFVFVVPDAAGKTAKAVFSEDLEPDAAVDIGGIAGTRLQVRVAGQPDAPIQWTKGEHEFTFDVPGNGPRLIFGTTVYGVMQRGNTKPFLLLYHPKTAIGDGVASQRLGDAVPAEVIAEKAAGGLRFVVLGRGKPLANSEVTVLVPGEKSSKRVKTDAAGRTPEFKPSGRYGVWARFVEAASGERNGKKYDETRHYATLVVDVGTALNAK
jgi:hypothetical protein